MSFRVNIVYIISHVHMWWQHCTVPFVSNQKYFLVYDIVIVVNNKNIVCGISFSQLWCSGIWCIVYCYFVTSVLLPSWGFPKKYKFVGELVALYGERVG